MARGRVRLRDELHAEGSDAVEIARIAGRLAAAVLGLIGVVLALVVNFAYSGVHDFLKISGTSTLDSSHGFIGLGLILLALHRLPYRALQAARGGGAAGDRRRGLLLPVGWFALIASPFMLLGALLAFIDKASERRRHVYQAVLEADPRAFSRAAII